MPCLVRLPCLSDFSNNFKLGAKLGHTSSKVFKCTLKKPYDGPAQYAVKRTKRWGLRESSKRALLQEVKRVYV